MNPSHFVAVVGGACAGSEIAHGLAELGMEVAVFEQNPLPYGKIEDGLPIWHEKLQIREKKNIDTKLSHPNIHFVPSCKLGEDVTLVKLRGDLGLPLVVLATGAWRDRGLRVDGIDAVTDDSFLYQNPLVYWFNHQHEANFSGRTYRIEPGAAVIGGGLASIDVAKICMFELTKRAAAEHGVTCDLLHMEHKGIFSELERHGLDFAQLGIQPARLFYRKRIIDMPLVPMPDNPSEDKLAKAEKVRIKLIDNCRRKYGFEVHELRSPTAVEVVDGGIRKLTLGVNQYKDGRFSATGETETIACRQIISSIGSIPEEIKGVAMRGELYDTDNAFTGELAADPGVYLVGNAITGRGNIKDSMKNAQRLSKVVTANINGDAVDFEQLFKSQAELAKESVAKLEAYLKGISPQSEEQQATARDAVKKLQEERGYGGDFATWRDQVLAAR
ncbi:hypothetical protein [Acanthopleuribacter pedis]|uniref:FAD/NAD(P)-binding domain-containing protein n=1 Tax=Acanthopleuribacter pedis TaxID=442870 RepID=A0A8J7Q6D6_9BACT|nr:hypothetical protein [Acanthopleuribacter pedis]MBO1318912.1 hypothetical protein [Acanthopleuribacter pedis]